MFEIGQPVVCTKPIEEDWFCGVPAELCPENVPVTGGLYTIREIVSGSPEPGGPHWTKAPGIIGLLLNEVVNAKRFTTNGHNNEQAFWEGNFMPLDDLREQASIKSEMVA